MSRSTFHLFVELTPRGAVTPVMTYSGNSRVPTDVTIVEKSVHFAAKDAWTLQAPMSGPCMLALAVYLPRPARVTRSEPYRDSDDTTAFAALVIRALRGVVLSDTRQVVGITVSKLWCPVGQEPGFKITLDALAPQEAV
jgi:hypothetical protein